MRASDFGNVDKVESRVHISRKLAIEKVHKDAARWCGLSIVGADGRGGIQDDDLLAIVGGGDCLLLAKKLERL